MIKRAALAAGFTLIEMAIVLVVIGLVLSGGIVAVTPIVQNTKVSETNQKLDRIEQALILHAIRYSCLPCPAAPGNASTVATVGQAVAGGTPYTSGCQAGACTNAQGVVPWINLNLSETEASDGFGTRISYAITANLQNTDGMKRTPPAGYPAGTITVQNAAGVEVTGGVGNRAAYVLISHGKDQIYGYRAQTGTQNAVDPTGSTVQDNNNNAPHTFKTIPS